MNLVEYLFHIERCSEVTASYEVCDFWSVDEQGVYYFFTHKFDFADSFTGLLCDFEFYNDEMLFVDWQTLQPLFNSSISDPADFPKRDPVMRNQLIVIRGTCSGQCAERIRPYYGYAARLLPSCEPIRQITRDKNALFDAWRNEADVEICDLKADENVKIGTAIWSQKYATFADMLLDAAYWADCCRCVDAVIFNFDVYPQVNCLETDKAYAAIHIRDGQLEVVTGKALEKSYRKYCRYPAVDYDIENSISSLCGFSFKFERGTSDG